MKFCVFVKQSITELILWCLEIFIFKFRFKNGGSEVVNPSDFFVGVLRQTFDFKSITITKDLLRKLLRYLFVEDLEKMFILRNG